jgi:hypothetical protein
MYKPQQIEVRPPAIMRLPLCLPLSWLMGATPTKRAICLSESCQYCSVKPISEQNSSCSDQRQVPVQLKELSLTSPKITPEEMLRALALDIPSETIAAAIERTQSDRQRNRKLPTHLVVALIIP